MDLRLFFHQGMKLLLLLLACHTDFLFGPFSGNLLCENFGFLALFKLGFKYFILESFYFANQFLPEILSFSLGVILLSFSFFRP